jgi:DNA-binding LacI/PurR family transcriptional regulator
MSLVIGSPLLTRSRARAPEEAGPVAGGSSATASSAANRPVRVLPRRSKAPRRGPVDSDAIQEVAPRSHSVPTSSVAVVITEPTAMVLDDPFFSALLAGIYATLAERSLLLVLLTPLTSRDMELAHAYLTGNHVDGAILASLHRDNRLPNRLREARVPIVVCGTPARGIVASYVDANNRQGAALAVDHLISLGRRKIATISGNLDTATAVDRQSGYRDALAAAGLPLDPTLEEVGDFLPNRAHTAMERLLLNHPDVDAVFAASDLMAAAALRVLQQARRRIPEDVAIVGFDDSPTARATNPPLSSVRQGIVELGREAVLMLMDEMQEPERAPRHLILGTELVVRQSSAGVEAAGPSD